MTHEAGRASGARLPRRGYIGAILSLAWLFGVFAGGVAQAQSAPPPATLNTLDGNGVDMVTGAFHLSSPGVSIGQPGMGGLGYQRAYDSSISGWRDNLTGTINSSGTAYTVTLMGAAETFTLTGGVYNSTEGSGGSLSFNGTTTYTYATSSGVIAIYLTSLASTQPTQANVARVSTLTAPSGEVLTFTYTALSATPFLAHRLQSVTNNLGYQLSFEYQTSTADATGLNLIKVTAINNAVDYCAPTANGCGLSGWPTLSFGIEGALASPTAYTVTDALSRTTRYAVTSARITGVRWPSSGADDVTVAYTGGRVSSVTSAAGAWAYNWTDTFVMGVLTTTTGVIIDPLFHIQTFVADFPANRVTEYRDGLNNVTRFTYLKTPFSGSLTAPTRTTQPEGNYTELTRDARGNVTQTRQVAKAGSGLADIVSSATYPASCANPITCNLPTTTTDARGFVTTYNYSAVHGGLVSVIAPDPDGAGPLPQPATFFDYGAPQFAWYKNASGTIVQAPSAVQRLTTIRSCATTASCFGGADETRTTITYGASGVANNLLPTSTSSGAGDGSLTAIATTTYDTIGNALTVDGPLAGGADLARVRYDVLRRRIGIIGPDPDGGGALKHRALRTTYNAFGQASVIERGTVNSQSDGDWSAFAPLEQVSLTYDAAHRRIQENFVAGGSTHAVTQYSYDAASRPDCVAVRMNPAVFGSLPGACTLSTEGAGGPDRISRTTYDAANRVLTAISGYATSAQQVSASQSYSANGQAATLTDANGNLTTTEYDGFDRVRKIRFPNASGGGSSASDYEQYTYDAGSNVTQDRRRDGAVVNFAYDNLSRVILMDAPAPASDVVTAYDNFSRAISVAYAGAHTLSFAYDQLSRNVSATRVANGATQVLSYQYDLAGRRTRVTWPDGFYAGYDVDVSGAVTAIRENGAASGIGVLATYAYDDYGRRTSVSRGNGVATAYAYDSASRLESLSQDLASTASDQTLSFTYNASGQALTRTASNAAYVWTQPALGANNSTANGRNQIAALNGANFTYDARGNLTATGAASYGYDVYNRLTSAGSATLAYDPVGRLYQTVGGGVTTRFLYDGLDAIAEYNASNVMQRRYVHGPGIDEPIVWYEGAGTIDRRWLVQDQLGSVIAVTNSSGAAISTNSYDEYGIPGASNSGRFQYTGQIWLPEAALYHYKARAYAPSLGRFLQSDPILYAGGMNLYAYVGNDPVNFTDPLGLFCRALPPEPDGSFPGECPRGYDGPSFGILGALERMRDAAEYVQQGAGESSGGGEGSESEEDGEGDEEEIDWQCVAERANAGGFTGAFVGGAAAIGAGARLVPYDWVPGYERFGLGGRNIPGGGRTSVLSAVARSFIAGSAGRSVLGTASLGGAIGRVASRASIVAGVGLEVYAGAQVLQAIEDCSEDDDG